MTSCLTEYRKIPLRGYMKHREYIIRYIVSTPLLLFQYNNNKTSENHVGLFNTIARFYNIENDSYNLDVSNNLDTLSHNRACHYNLVLSENIGLSDNMRLSNTLNSSSSATSSLPTQNPYYRSLYTAAVQSYDSVGVVQLLPRTLYRINKKVRR